MIAGRHLVTLLLLVAPLQAIAGQGQGSAPPRMTPEQRTAAQAKFGQQVDRLTSVPLSDAKTQLRKDVMITRDSVAAAVATASLIHRAQSTRSVGVERSQARRLRGQCSAAQRSSSATLRAISPLNASDPKGTKLLVEYRAALAAVGRRMGECDRMLAPAKDGAGPASAQITAAVREVNDAATVHDRALDNLMRGLEIPLR